MRCDHDIWAVAGHTISRFDTMRYPSSSVVGRRQEHTSDDQHPRSTLRHDNQLISSDDRRGLLRCFPAFSPQCIAHTPRFGQCRDNSEQHHIFQQEAQGAGAIQPWTRGTQRPSLRLSW